MLKTEFIGAFSSETAGTLVIWHARHLGRDQRVAVDVSIFRDLLRLRNCDSDWAFCRKR